MTCSINGITMIDDEDMKWDDLKVFLALMKHGHFAAAGEHVGVSASTASRRLERLETALMARLFVRTPDGLLPTDLAEELAPIARDVEAHTLRLARRAAREREHVRGSVRFALPEALGVLLIAPVIPRLRERYPELSVEYVASATLTDLMRREADLALRFARPTSNELVVKRLASLPYSAFGSDTYLSAHTSSSPREHRWVSWVDELGERQESRWHGEHVGEAAHVLTDNALMGIAAAQSGAGLVLLPRPLGHLTPLLEPCTALPEIDLSADLWLVSHVDLRRSPGVEAVWGFVLERVQEALAYADTLEGGL